MTIKRRCPADIAQKFLDTHGGAISHLTSLIQWKILCGVEVKASQVDVEHEDCSRAISDPLIASRSNYPFTINASSITDHIMRQPQSSLMHTPHRPSRPAAFPAPPIHTCTKDTLVSCDPRIEQSSSSRIASRCPFAALARPRMRCLLPSGEVTALVATPPGDL